MESKAALDKIGCEIYDDMLTMIRERMPKKMMFDDALYLHSLVSSAIVNACANNLCVSSISQAHEDDKCELIATVFSTIMEGVGTTMMEVHKIIHDKYDIKCPPEHEHDETMH